ncbi:MAG TPA: hypothetical protein VFY89_03595 [Ktedonobacterales bacterium]
MPGYAYPPVGLLRAGTAIAALCALALGVFVLAALGILLQHQWPRQRLRAGLAAILPPAVFALLALLLAQAAWAAVQNAGLPVPPAGYAQPIQDAVLLLPLVAALVAVTVSAIWLGVSQLTALRRNPLAA